MAEPITCQIILAARPHGRPRTDDFRIEQTAMPIMAPGGVLIRVLCLSLDPYMRGLMDEEKSYAKPVEIGEVMPGRGVPEVIASDDRNYAKSDIVVAPMGSCTYTALRGVGLRELDPSLAHPQFLRTVLPAVADVG